MPEPQAPACLTVPAFSQRGCPLAGEHLASRYGAGMLDAGRLGRGRAKVGVSLP